MATSEEVESELHSILLQECEEWLPRFNETWLKNHPDDLELALCAAFADGFRRALPKLRGHPVIDHLPKRKSA